MYLGSNERMLVKEATHASILNDLICFVELLKGFALKWQQYKAMLIKRFLNSKRDKKAVITQLLPYRSSWCCLAAKDYLKTVKVDVKDVTDDVKAILSGNSNDSITVRGTSYSYTAPKDDKPTSCCDYEFLVLNPKCQSDFLNASLSVDTCSKNDKFGYKNCKSCLLNTNSDSCQTLTINKTTLSDMNMYFTEYVLEQSNAKNFFNTHVAGFTLAPLPKIIKPSNSSNSKIIMPSTMSTVWYSNQSEKDSSGIGALFLAIFLSMGMAFMAASFITFIVHERSSKAMLIAVFICRVPGSNSEKEGEIMHHVFMLFPTY
ncbi:hypothetical protein QZH41_017131, partial [Actinostola sp. cb2023]